jgi:hypothetical protein
MVKPEADMVDRRCDAVRQLTAGRAAHGAGPHWVMLHDVTRHLGISEAEAQQAVAAAVERGRLMAEGGDPVHSVALTGW